MAAMARRFWSDATTASGKAFKELGVRDAESFEDAQSRKQPLVPDMVKMRMTLHRAAIWSAISSAWVNQDAFSVRLCSPMDQGDG